ncbi:MAG TPA: winged helix-turn-helix domain-containing protein [Caulobacteraceae bacterium]|jgi:predicted ATPase/DNA-binding winged helix-turn-helix (wHTH) protein
MNEPSGVNRGSANDTNTLDDLREDGGRGPSDSPDPDRAFAFGAFTLQRSRRRLERDGATVPLGDKAFEILRALVEHAGQIVSKVELLRQASIANDDSLRFHIAALRKALGEGRYIANVAGQGYSFVAPVSRLLIEAAVERRRPLARPLPARLRPLIGRNDVLKALPPQLLEHRFVTIVGPGGVGKTSVALTLAHDLASRFDGDVCFFDVGSVFNSEFLEGGLAAALGIPGQPSDAAPGIVTVLRRRRMLLILDGCEPGVDAVASLAETLFQEAPDVHILATSREALRADGEHVHRLFPLGYPTVGAGATAAEALEFPAVQLFVERVASSLHDFTLADEEAPLVSGICRKLDGLALAIELAAGRVDSFGVREVARQLESQFALLWPARRTAIARHQTLNATLGWSHQLLSLREQTAFRRLSVFAGGFNLQMATAVIADEEISEAEAIELVGSLVSKSLVQFNREDCHGIYRLLDMTRSYAFDRLTEANEAGPIAERHARLIRRILENGGLSGTDDFTSRAVDLLDDVSSAIEWSLSPEGDPEIGAALAVGSAPVWLQTGLLVECKYWMARVLNAVGPTVLGPARELALQSALASAETFTEGFTKESFKNWQRCYATAIALGDVLEQVTCLVVLWAHRIRSPDYPDALELARTAENLVLASPDRGVRALADWMVGISNHHLGRLETAKLHLERSLAGDTLEARQAMMAQFGYDRRIPSIGALANLHWLEGRPDAALEFGATAVSEARRSPYPVPLCEALTWQALTVHLRGDDPDQVDALLDEALAHARPHFIESYVGLSLALKGLNEALRGDPTRADLVSEGLDLLSKSHYEVFHPLILTEFARVRAQAGVRLDSDEIAELLQLDIGVPENWNSAEVRRNLGEVLLRQGDAGKAAQLFAASADGAERQGALGWGLRTALSIARSATGQASRRQSKDRLAALLQRFTEGLDTADLQAARLFLADSVY